MPIRAHVGSGEGVMKASMIPETRSTAVMPMVREMMARPSSARTWARGRRPGAITRQPRRMPAPAARNTAVSSNRPCGVISPKKSAPLPAWIMSPPMIPTFAAFAMRT
jgi:hypothetical protein